MPTAVSAARQCLAAEAAAALDEGVEVAQRRSHAQTTSLHVVSSLLSLPSSSSSVLRDALARARDGAAYSPRLHFKALEFCFFVALDRLPSVNASTQQAEPPPVSNSLMAAIKRSQANQRRNPETFHLYQQQQSQSSATAFAGVKVELQQLILSILDDPVVSRVFGEAGFRSCDIKLAILRPPPLPSSSILRFPRCPPLFLCSFSAAEDVVADPVLPRAGFGFPFARQEACPDVSGENCRRIGEVLVRQKGRSPLLVGAGAADALRDFEELVNMRRWGTIPEELTGIRLLQMGDRDRAWIGRVTGALQEGAKGVLLSFGDLRAFLEDDDEEEKEKGSVVCEVTRMLGESSGRMWLVGCSATYETYMKFLARYPSVDKDWDLQLLPITSVKAGSACSIPKTSSFMDSFVPFGGFFPVATNSFLPSTKLPQPAFRCPHCNENYEQELAMLLKENSLKLADLHRADLPSWMQNAHTTSLANTDMVKAKDGGTTLNEKIADLQKRWNEVCQCLHRGVSGLVPDVYVSAHDTLPRIVGFPVSTDSESLLWKNSGMGMVRSFSESKFPAGLGIKNTPTTKPSLTVSVTSELSNANPLYAQEEQVPKGEKNKYGVQLRLGSRPDIVTPIDLPSPTSASSVSTDLVLGSFPPSTGRNPAFQANILSMGDVSQCIPFNKSSAISRSISAVPIQSLDYHSWPGSPHLESTLGMPNQLTSRPLEDGSSKLHNKCLSSSTFSTPFDPKDFKSLYRSLIEKIGRQEEAIGDISETITLCRTGNARRNGIWLHFTGPDRVGKKRIAVALAELLFSDRDKFIHVDLGLQDGSPKYNNICDELGVVGCDGNFRGKMTVDHIFMEINNRPWSVLFLENVDMADVLVQSSLSQAIKTGRFPDSHGREISICNAVVVTTSKEVSKDNAVQNAIFSEEKIWSAQKWQLEIVVESAYKPLSVNPKPFSSNQSPKDSPYGLQCPVYVHKRKLYSVNDSKEQGKSSESVKRPHKVLDTFLDLNIPFEAAASGTESSSVESSSTLSENSSAWIDEFLSLVDKNVVFKQFDFDILADNLTREIGKCFQDTIGPNCRLEIDEKAMEQILAATWLLEDMGFLSKWLQQVLAISFTEACERYNLSFQTVLRLVANEDLVMEEEAPGIHLPSKIMVS